MLLRIITIDLLAGAALITVWYLLFLQRNRRKAVRVLGWIERAFSAHGRIAGVQWMAASRFSVRLRLLPNLFRRTSIIVQLFPREMPFNWLLCRLRKQQETLTFEADLDYPPAFDLEIHNHRWCGRTRRRFSNASQNWTMEQTAPYVLTTRNNWQREITTLMNALLASRECDCMTVCFRQKSPHFSATVPLESISPEAQADSDIFDILRELATGASASRF